ncbi:MAG: MarR family transcriptional regulator [Solirubrobacterales bacterium]|nr:MarR family transcriptional regulator [Solirubrobacterales bacterium]
MLNMSTPVQAPPDADLLAFSSALEEFGRAQRRVAGRFNRAPAVPELSKPQYLLLEPLLAADGPRCVSDLADAAGVSAPTATRMLDGLVRRGIATRSQKAGDRRIVLIGLTRDGRELMHAKHARVLEARAAIYAQLHPTEQRGAARLLSRLAAAIEELQP